MRFPFLFTMGLCALLCAIKAQAIQMTEVIPDEEKVQIQVLANGVKTYVQEHPIPLRCGSFRVVLRNSSSEDSLHQYDGKIESLEAVEEFFNDCKQRALAQENLSIDGWQVSNSDITVPENRGFREIAVVAVGDFSTEEMQSLIERYFGSLVLDTESLAEKDPGIQLYMDSQFSKVAVHLSYPIARRSIQTYADLKQTWNLLLLQDLFQQRLEHCSKRLDEVWVHPRPRFFSPVNGYSLVSEEDFENLFSFLLWQVEVVRKEGFYPDEFYISKRRLLDQLQYLASKAALPDDAFLASYYVEQFLIGDRCLSCQAFAEASAKLIEEVQPQDLVRDLSVFFHEENRFIRLTYPMSRYSEHITKDRIEYMLERIASLASFYQESEFSEDSIWTLETKNAEPLQSDSRFDSEFTRLISDIEPRLFQLSENRVMREINPAEQTQFFYQLPITDKEKRFIKIILTTMAEKNIIQLAFIKRSLEKKGKKIEHIHPMRFMGHILSNAELRNAVKIIRKSSFKWDAFISGFARRMREEASNNNLFIHVPGFSHQVGISQEEVMRFIQKKDWEGLVKESL